MAVRKLSVDPIPDDPGLDPVLLEEALAPHLEGRIEVVLADPGYMRMLNSKYRHMDRPTDVLAFDMRDDPGGEPEGVIYVDCRLFPPMEELVERICHGYLHLRGFTHDTEEDAGRMEEEVAALAGLIMNGSAR